MLPQAHTYAQEAPTAAQEARQLLQPKQTVKVNATDIPGRYFVSVESQDGLHVVNGERLISKREAHDLAAHVRTQLVFQRLAAEAQPNRMARAMALVAAGKVSRNGSGYYVQSQTDAGQRYHVNGAGCDCPDATYNQPAGGCKHQMAVKLFQRATVGSPAEEAPAQPPTPTELIAHLAEQATEQIRLYVRSAYSGTTSRDQRDSWEAYRVDGGARVQLREPFDTSFDAHEFWSALDATAWRIERKTQAGHGVTVWWLAK